MLKYALIPLLPFAGFLIAGLFGKYLKERAAYVAVGGVAGAFLFSVDTSRMPYTLHVFGQMFPEPFLRRKCLQSSSNFAHFRDMPGIFPFLLLYFRPVL